MWNFGSGVAVIVRVSVLVTVLVAVTVLVTVLVPPHPARASARKTSTGCRIRPILGRLARSFTRGGRPRASSPRDDAEDDQRSPAHDALPLCARVIASRIRCSRLSRSKAWT